MRYKSFIESTTSKDDPKFKDLYLFHGKSAYQAAVEMGYPGTEEEWIESLRELRWGTSVEEFDGFTDLNKQHDIAYIDYVHGKIYRYDEEKKEFVDTEISTYDKEGNPIHTTFLKRSGGIMTCENPLLFEKSAEYPYESNHIRFNKGLDRIGADSNGNIGAFASGKEMYHRVDYTTPENSRGTYMSRTVYRPIADNEMDLGANSFRWKNVYGVNYKGTSYTGDTFTGKLIGNADTATKFASGKKIGIGGAVTSTPTAFDNSKDITIPITAVNPSYITQNASYRMVTDTNIAYWNAKPTKAEMNTAISTAIANLIDNSPDLLNTLDELAAALGDDPNFATTMTTELGKKVNKAGDTMTGTLNSRSVIPTANNSYNLGSASLKYANAYATIFHGTLSGYATGAHCLQTYSAAGGTHGTNLLLSCQYSLRSRAGGATFDLYVEDGTVHKVACDVSTVAATLGRNGNYTLPMTFNWSGQSGQPSWIWGGNDGTNMYVYNPANFSVASATTAANLSYFKCTSGANVGADTTDANAIGYVSAISILGQVDGAIYKQVYSASWVHEIYGDYRTGQIAVRGKNNGTWQAWRTILDSANYKSYALALTGGTVSGATTFSSTLTASGRFTANGRITVPSVGGSWISGMTLTNCSIQVSTQNTSGSYHPIIGGKTYGGHFWNIGTITNTVGFYGFKAGRTANAFDWQASWDITTGNFTNTGTITGSKVFNPVWNDYAEWYEKEDLEETFEPGDIVTWGEDGVVKTTEAFDPCVVGVYSDTYGHIVGGKQRDNMEDNIKDHVPVGLCGRVHVKVTGKAKRGDLIVSSDIPGVGMAISPKHAYPGVIIGKVLKNKDSEDIEKIKIQIMLQ